MVRTYKKKRQQKYSEDDVTSAVRAVKEGMGYSAASKMFNVPRNTIRSRITHPPKRIDVHQIFTDRQEKALSDRIFYLSDRGFPVTITDFRMIAHKFAMTLHRRKKLNRDIPRHWVKNGTASYEWWLSFKKRHHNISLRVAEGLSSARAEAFCKARVSSFFSEAEALYEELDIHSHPMLIYNCDETGLSSVPNGSCKVLARKGDKSVQKICVGERGTLTTLLVCVNAVGDTLPPFVIFKGPCPNDDGSYIPDVSLNSSKSGYVDKDLFVKFLHHFQQHRQKVVGKKCLLILDGHHSHVSISALDFAEKNGIELLCLPPHSTHRLQPLDTHYNKSLKNFWRTNLDSFLKSHERMILNKENFLHVLRDTLQSMKNNSDLIVKGFRYCGLFPLSNVVADEEFVKSSIYSENVSEKEDTPKTEESVVLRVVANSPKKKSNAYHSKPHTARLSMKENPSDFKDSTSKAIGKRVKRKSEDTPSSSKRIHIEFNKPVSSKKRQVAPGFQEDSACCVCFSKYSVSWCEWYKCVNCAEWACENCFGLNTCANC